jgi:hypothetical protein
LCTVESTYYIQLNLPEKESYHSLIPSSKVMDFMNLMVAWY